ncbi:Alanine--tRNA ligase [Phytophthora cactorum]|uniref:Alanine--tRNA ligase n=1 Tax=Phytophthora cactorum TaxID=29920 RepID=A0A329S7T4_9STRA|nr:Alanine--tRNA ligase [Phytophthora cactorum]KAG2822687.1 Alanine--tRNA ligase [Phytophthora cactorum]KAG2855715.1 Alanine--tRNA ligase [Phytophthora cactorum]KAG2902059.1 Alanine--tRNA ligase [Phytophthora cactorum]KAG2935121.1 Alanine--tRNA ligase [Phytophthora cactorum]
MLRLRRYTGVGRKSAARDLHSLPSAELRNRFLQFFEDQGHRVVPSASLVPPGGDHSLLFVNAGMVPFKQAFLGIDGGAEARGYSRATSAQRCVRAGGKHNDLDQVGLTRRHHTMFEMLGNFSFGDYFKEQAIAMCWCFLTQELRLPIDRLHVTVLKSDQEARRLWKQIAGLPDHKILELDENENFWAMGDSGPCGPCSEVFWDLGDHIADPDERFLELWNLVFMQFFRNEGESKLHALPSCSVDTGMGLERVASVLQGVPSNYHTDVFVPLLEEVASVLDAHRSSTSRQTFTSALQEELDPSKDLFGTGVEIQTLRIVSDHLRATYALLHDGVFPSNVGRGYVLRRIVRRAIRHAQQLGVKGGSDGILASIAVPDWTETAGFQQMRAIVSNEERAFEEMLRNGRGAIDKAFFKAQVAQTMLSGADAFRLYDTYGIPLDITQVLAEEKGLTVDVEGYDACMKSHKQQTSDRSAFTGHHTQPSSAAEQSSANPAATLASEFMGYDQLRVLNARVLDSWPGPSSKKGGSTEFNVILDRCPFFPEGGGQVGDRGHLIITSVDSSIRIAVPVTNTTKVNEDAIVLKCSPPKDMTYEDISALFLRGDDLKPTVEAHVDRKFRSGCAVHHTATHLLQRALKAELGEHVTQAGSQVTSDRLRFDFAHFGAMSPAEMASVEARVNAFAAAELDVTTVQLPREEAERSGAICNFGDKYGDVVRVVRIGGGDDVAEGGAAEAPVSSEFCGGTHVKNVKEIFPFALVSEGSVAAGTRRVEAVAGQAGARFLQAKAQTLSEVADQLSTTPAKVVERVTKMQKQMKQLESRAQALGDLLATLPSTPLASGPIDGLISVPQVELHALDLPGGGEFSKVLKRRSEFLAEQGSPTSVLLVLLGSQVACIANAEAEVHAGKLLQQVVKPLGGRGGGNASFAQGSVPADLSAQEITRRVLSLAK